MSADAVLMVRPASFGFNPETADSNRYQQDLGGEGIDAAARREIDGIAGALGQAGIEVCLVEDSARPRKPDAVFPNNWVSFHEDGTVVLYPMEAPSRRLERRRDVVAEVIARTGFVERRRLDLTAHEAEGRYLEGTGSLVLDPVARVAYACRSSRTNPALVAEWGEAMGYDVELFDARGPDSKPVYHTNVILAIGAGWAVVAESMLGEADQERVVDRLERSGREVVRIDAAAVRAFAGNLLELAGPTLVLSDTALRALRWSALDVLERHATLLPVHLPTIEAVGGGGVRCTLCEVPLSRTGTGTGSRG